MKYITYKNSLLLILAIILLLISIRLYSGWSFPDTNWVIGKDDSVVIANKEIAIQKFEASRDNLSRIEFLFGKSRKIEGGKITLQIFDENCLTKLREISRHEKPFDSDKAYDFVFSKIANSKNQKFCLKFLFEPDKDTKGLKIFLMNNASPENIYLSINNEEKIGQSLSMRPAYINTNLLGNIEELNQRISQYKPFFLKHYFLYVIVFGFIILSISLVIILMLL